MILKNQIMFYNKKMNSCEILFKNLTGKNEHLALKAANELVNSHDNEKFIEYFSSKFEFLFDFVQNNVKSRIEYNINSSNYLNLLKFFKYYSYNLDNFIISILVKYANEDLTDKILEIFESTNSSDTEKTYCAKYFYYIPDTIALDILKENAFSDFEPLMLNCAGTLNEMQDYTMLDKALKKLDVDDDFEVLKAVKFITASQDKKHIKQLYQTLKKSRLKENIACEIPYLIDIFNEIKHNDEDALFCFNCIINGFGEILPLCEVFNYKIKQIVNYLTTKKEINQNEAIVILNTMLKFDLITQNDEYTFDENKQTKNELNEIQKIFENIKPEYQTNLKNILINKIEPHSIFLTDILNLIAEYQIYEAKDILTDMLKTSNDFITCEIIITLKKINKLDNNINQDEIINKIQDNNIRAIVKSCF